MNPLPISEQEAQELNYHLFCQTDASILKRFICVWLFSKIQNQSEVARITGLHRNTVGSYVKIYRTGGIEGLSCPISRRRPSALCAYSEQIKASFQAAPPHSVKEAGERIFEMTGIRRRLTQTREHLLSMGFGFRKMGHIPAKADPSRQAQFLSMRLKPLIGLAENELITLLFMDAAHFVLEPFITAVWCLARLFLPASAGRNRINVLGAVNAVTKCLTATVNTTYIDAQVIIEFLSKIHAQYAHLGVPICIVLDNARYQHCKAVKDAAAQLGIYLSFLPPYSPNLNIIERLWKFIKKKVLYGKYYPTPALFHSAITDFVAKLHTNIFKEELDSCLSLKFQTFEHAQSMAD